MTRSSPRIVFMGTPAFAVPALETVARLGRVVAVYTVPDKPAGRGLRPRPSAVKAAALALHLPVVEPRSLRTAQAVEELRGREPDVVVVAAYGKILPPAILEIPPFGCLNVHASLLPRHRGAAPIQGALLAGDRETGVTIMLMDEGLDTGPILAAAACPIGPDDTAGSLTPRLARLGADLLASVLPRWLDRRIVPIPQDSAAATMTAPIRKDAGVIRWDVPAARIERQVRAYTPWPGAATVAAGRPLKVLRAHVTPNGSAAPGTLAERDRAPAVATADGWLVLDAVQPAGGRVQSGVAWLNGHRHLLGTRLPS